MAELEIRGATALFDDEDSKIVLTHKWWITPQGYACTKIRRQDGSRRTIGMHRIILGDPDVASIDHINRNKLDNRRCNLRECTDSENGRNIKTRHGKSSSHRGVSFRKGLWQVVVRVDGKLKWLGCYKTEDEAANIASPYFIGIAP